MAFVVGSGSILQIGKEATWSESTTPTALVNFTSESINVTVNKGDEGNILSKKLADTRDKLSVDVAGDVSFILRPEFAGLMMGAALGKEPSDPTAGTLANTYKHTFTLLDPGDALPSLTAVIDRGKVATGSTHYIAKYPGMTVSSLTLDCAANDYVKGTVSLQGKNATTGTLESSLTTFSHPSYKMLGAGFHFGSESTTICASSVSITLDEKLEDEPRTYCTGLYKGQPMPATRELSIKFEMPYNTRAKEIEDAFYDSNSESNDVNISDLILTFGNGEKTGDVNNFPMQIKFNAVAITNVTHSISGPGAVTASFEGYALAPTSTEPIEVEVTDLHSTKWI